MHALCLCILVSTFSVHEALDNVPAEFHGKEIGFTRRVPIIGKYTHKGIIFVPSEYTGEQIKEDSMGNPIKESLTYILHLWYPGNSKSKARIRIDPLRDVLLGDEFAIQPDSDNALPTEVAIARALYSLGQYHRGVPYHFLGNNCGHFVAWCKYGSSKYDTQFQTFLHRQAQKNKIPYGPVFAQRVYTMVDKSFSDPPTPIKY